MPHDFALQACPEFLADFSDFIDGSLPAGRRSELEAHLDCCEGCLRHLSAYRRGIGAYREIAIPGVDPDEFWLGLKIRLASEDAVVRTRTPAWRAPAMAGAAVALVALATVWLGLRIDAGFRTIAERPLAAAAVEAGAETESAAGDARILAAGPVAVAAPETGAASEGGVRLASASGSRPDVARTNARAAARTSARATDPDPAIQREFEQLREEMEMAAWLGDPYLEASDRSFAPAQGGVRIQTAGWTY